MRLFVQFTLLFVTLLLFNSCSLSKLSELLDEATETERLNQTLIYDFFISYELTEKNWNSQALLNYAPQIHVGQAKQITVDSEIVGQEEYITYKFNEQGNLMQIIYQVDRGGNDFSRYYYDLYYQDGRLSYIYIGDKRKIEFTYSELNRLTAITRNKNEAIFEYHFEYQPGQHRADIKLEVIKDGEKRASSRPYFVEWDDELRLRAFSIDTYQTHDIVYSEQGTPVAMQFDATKQSDVDLSWEYIYDDKGNWIEKTFKENWYKREIQYITRE